MPIRGHVFVYHPQHDKWEEPNTVMDIEGEDFSILMPQDKSKVCLTGVKGFSALLQRQNRLENQGCSIN